MAINDINSVQIPWWAATFFKWSLLISPLTDWFSHLTVFWMLYRHFCYINCFVVILYVLQVLSAPLDALCDFQIQHGAVQHHSKEYKIANGLWQKPLPRKVIRRMEKEKQLTERNHCIDQEKRWCRLKLGWKIVIKLLFNI